MSDTPHLLQRIILGGKHYSLENVPRDGDCFFHCITGYAHGSALHSQQYQREVCNTVFNNWEQWGQEICLYHGEGMMMYLFRGSLLMHKGWATNFEIDVTSLLYCSNCDKFADIL